MEKQRKRMSETASDVRMSENDSLKAGFRSTMIDMRVPTMPSTLMTDSRSPSTTKTKVASPTPSGQEEVGGVGREALGWVAFGAGDAALSRVSFKGNH